MTLTSLASAQTIGDERRALTIARTEATAATARSLRFEAAAAAAVDEATRARARSAAIAARIQSAEAEVGAAEARVALTTQLQTAQRVRLAERQAPTIRLLAALQVLSRRPPALAIVQPGSVSEMVYLRAMLAGILPLVEQRTAGVRAEIARAKALQTAAAAAFLSIKASQRALIEQRNRLAGLALERRKASEALSGNAMVEQDRAIALGEDARDIVELMGRIDADASRSARLASLPGPAIRPLRPGEQMTAPADPVLAQAPQAPYRLPVVGRIVTGLGEVSASGVRARGLTIATRPAAQVVAPRGGRIAFAAPFRGFGTIVIIDHGYGWTTVITNMGGLDVRVGDVIDQGSPIGRAARSTISFELRRNGIPVDIARLVS